MAYYNWTVRFFGLDYSTYNICELFLFYNEIEFKERIKSSNNFLLVIYCDSFFGIIYFYNKCDACIIYNYGCNNQNV